MASNILQHAAIRSAMKSVAISLVHFDSRRQAAAFLEQLQIDLHSLSSEEFPETYRQAVADFDGPTAYGLERIGFLPASR